MTSKLYAGTALLLTATLLLSGCVNREQADTKLSKACGAAAVALLPEGAKIDSIKSFTASPSPEGPDHRYIEVTAIYVDGWIEQENVYKCVFQEGFGFLNSGYTATTIKVDTGERIIGKSGDEISGDAQDWLKITDAVRSSLYEE